tara:strand:- start:430 stop:906 length:477 start_codon:yes stop_codon:yes gene_type:complete
MSGLLNIIADIAGISDLDRRTHECRCKIADLYDKIKQLGYASRPCCKTLKGALVLDKEVYEFQTSELAIAAAAADFEKLSVVRALYQNLVTQFEFDCQRFELACKRAISAREMQEISADRKQKKTAAKTQGENETKKRKDPPVQTIPVFPAEKRTKHV